MVTIIVPVYNTEKYLERCVRSVMAQTYKDLEIILVDDGSTDSSGKMADELAVEDGRIRVIHQVNGGSSRARNTGIDNAHGDYIGFVDSDDYIDEDFVSLMMDAIERYDVQMAQISRDEIDEQGERRPDVCIPPSEESLITSEEQLRELLMHRGDCSFCTRITKRELFDDMRFPEDRLNEDFYLLVEMLGVIDKYVILPKQAYHVFYRMGSNSRREDPEDFSRVFTDIVVNADHVEELVSVRYPFLTETAKRFALIQRLDYMLHIPISAMNKDNVFYNGVKRYLRKNFGRMILNRYLTPKNKAYLAVLAIMPRTVRSLHRKVKSIKR
ncbi:MAG: glycosyltransferase [Lachnospiraceae bacterium]|nr:glycosyltransferase [Lachnospiraceae bacterium]